MARIPSLRTEEAMIRAALDAGITSTGKILGRLVAVHGPGEGFEERRTMIEEMIAEYECREDSAGGEGVEQDPAEATTAPAENHSPSPSESSEPISDAELSRLLREASASGEAAGELPQ